MSWLDQVHQSHVADRRVSVLLRHFQELAPPDASVLDVGCGDGRLTAALGQARPDLRLRGVDVLVREQCDVDVTPFDGSSLPFEDSSFDAVMFVDVLHHTEDPMVLLREARRVSRRAILIKDHFLQGLLSGPTLRFMDRVGNARHGVALPHNYWRPAQWEQAFRELGLRVAEQRGQLGLYWWPASMLFERGLHFVARLEPDGPPSQATLVRPC
ncbi:MAG: methyltransferase domain-containing protein [Planctomycetales bacterium]|nr:methyltransferase domain-containing protein [Planctomycetales bacterium]